MRMSGNFLTTAFPKSAGSWVALIGAAALIISAIILGFMLAITGHGSEGVIGDFLLNAGLFLGIQKAGSVAQERVRKKYEAQSDCDLPTSNNRLRPMGPPAGDGADG